MTIALSDSQVDHIQAVCRPLQPHERMPFMAALLEELIARRDELGDGSLGRMLRDLQRRHFQPPPSEVQAGLFNRRAWNHDTSD